MTTSNNEADRKAQQEAVKDSKVASSNKVKTKKKTKNWVFDSAGYLYWFGRYALYASGQTD
ncbi:hypothetical protein JCM18901_1256 [Psychrobacter sp. JCM 18901]|nr:hypothetical protein JCM18901_1256 [Psychrobacter sp. JCM 18901]